MTTCLPGCLSTRALRAKFDQILPHFDERRRRLYLASEATALGHGGIARVVEAFLRRLGAQPLPMTSTVNAVVDLIAADKSLTRVGDLAGRLGINARKLQRLFAEHVGLGPKWVINRCRIHEAADVAIGGAPVDWTELAAELGYSDQSHLIRDFTATVGISPNQYSRQVAQHTPAEAQAADPQHLRTPPHS
jgi:AraC-like DNA-binding protein